MSKEKQLSYQITNTYSVLNEYGPGTKNVWVVCHGIGYLSRYFIQHFEHLDPEENYIIAPQAQSKYYLNSKYTRIGASWLTREKTEAEIENVLNYLDEIYSIENLLDTPKLIMFGYSQGVSIASRWIARRKRECAHLIMHSGKVPQELQAEDFRFLKNTRFSFIYGKNDPYLNEKVIKTEEKRVKQLFPEHLKIHAFDGGHEVNQEIISEFAQE